MMLKRCPSLSIGSVLLQCAMGTEHWTESETLCLNLICWAVWPRENHLTSLSFPVSSSGKQIKHLPSKVFVRTKWIIGFKNGWCIAEMLKKSVFYFLSFLLGVLPMKNRAEYWASCLISTPAEIIWNVSKSFCGFTYLLIVGSWA